MSQIGRIVARMTGFESYFSLFVARFYETKELEYNRLMDDPTPGAAAGRP